MKSPTRLTGSLALALAASLVALALQNRMLTGLREEHGRFESLATEAARLSKENAGLGKLKGVIEEAARLREANADLHRLRNEVRQWRERSQDLDRLRRELQSAQAGLAQRRTVAASVQPGPLLTRDALAFQGFGTPEATLQTMLWSMREKDLKTLTQCVAASMLPDLQREISADGGRSFYQKMDEFKSFRIAARKSVSPTEALLGFQIHAGSRDQPEEVAVPFRLVNGQWKMDPSLEAPKP